MSYREKATWIALITLILCFGSYFALLLSGMTPPRGPETVRLFAICVGAFGLLKFGLQFAARQTTPKAEQGPPDEREQLIEAKSHTIGFYLLATLVLALGVPGHLGHPVPDLLNFALADVVVSSAVVFVAQIVMFRRGV